MALDKQRVTNIVNTIEQHFWDIVKTIPIAKHLARDYDDGFWFEDGGFWIETYYLSNTFYMFYLNINTQDFDENENNNIYISFESTIDSEYKEKYNYFSDLNKSYEFNISFDDFDDNNKYVDPSKLNDELNKGLVIILNNLKTHCQNMLKQIDKEIADNTIDFKKYQRLLHDSWLDKSVLIEFAEYNYLDIPHLLTYLGEEIMIRFIPQTVKDVFLF